jgi:hypothetical protein
MKALVVGMFLVLLTVCGFSQKHAAAQQAASVSDRERLIGAWRLASIVGPDGKPVTTGAPQGMLIYTRDGHMSVQLMYPDSGKNLSNEYVQNGYEASFGSYDVNDATHTVTHHVQGSVTRHLLVGKDLPRIYQIDPSGHLIIKSARKDERWSVKWEHY